MGMTQNMFSNTVAHGSYTSFSGADITAVIGGGMVGSLQAISYSVTREKGPVYVMNGSPDPKSFARGKRAVAGTLVFLTMDEQAFLTHMSKTASNQGAKFYGNKADIRYEYGQVEVGDAFGLFEQAVAEDAGFINPGEEKQYTEAWYADQILPFDVNISAANEYGQSMKKSFVGVEILNEGGGISVDDLVIEEQYTYICRGMTPWTKVAGTGQRRV